jgi:AcrR family transcriptional regulator
MEMPRTADPQRKPQLIAAILDYLIDKPLASVSFRTIAHALDVSTYTLVYHFGNRAELLREIVAAVSTRATGIEERLVAHPGSLDVYFQGLVESWEWTIQPRNRQLQRLEFEAALIEANDPAHHTFTRTLFDTWQRIGQESLESVGLSPKDAAVEARLVLDTFYGIQYDFVLNNDEPRATAAFELAVSRHRESIEQILGVRAR